MTSVLNTKTLLNQEESCGGKQIPLSGKMPPKAYIVKI
jgi:hypothetical protein